MAYDDDDKKGPGLGTYVGGAVAGAALTTGAAYGHAKLITRDSAIKDNASTLVEASQKRSKDWKAFLESDNGAHKDVLTTHVNPDMSAIEKMSVHELSEGLAKAAAKSGLAEDAKTAIGKTIKAFEPMADTARSFESAQKHSFAAKALKTKLGESTGLKQSLVASLEHSPVKVAIIAPIVTVGAVMALNAMRGNDRSQLSGSGHER